MQIRRHLRAYAVILASLFLAMAMYIALYAFMLKGMAATAQIDPVNGIKIRRFIPVYRKLQVFSVDWTETNTHGLAPIHYLDTVVRPKRWPKTRITALSPEVLQEIANEIAAEAGQNQRN